jgi:hypothetical protein
MSTVVPQQRGVEMFLVPKSIVKNGSLLTLSGNALALFIAISYRFYKTRSADIKMSLRDLYQQIELGGTDIKKAARELRDAKLIHFQQSENIMFFQLQMPDGSKAKVYLHPPKPAPAQDAKFAHNIEVA